MLPGDSVQGTVGLIDFKGESGTITGATPVGQYFEVVTGLTGASARNYKLASSGSLPGILEITPVWLSYTTASGVFLPETGFVGTPGIPTLRAGGTGGLLNGDDVTALVRAAAPDGATVTDFSTLQVGRYRFFVDSLTGPDASNYRIRPNFTVADSGPYATNDPGTLDVFASGRLGLGLAGPVTTPVPASIAPPAPQVTAPDLSGPGQGQARCSAADLRPQHRRNRRRFQHQRHRARGRCQRRGWRRGDGGRRCGRRQPVGAGQRLRGRARPGRRDRRDARSERGARTWT